MIQSDRPHADILYNSYGMQRPPQDVLHAVIELGSRQATPTADALAANACIDMAFHEPELATDWLETAHSLLEKAAECAERAVSSRHLKRISASVTEAATYAASLPNWHAAATGNPTAPDYPRLVRVAADTLWLSAYGSQAKSKLLEFTPVLLGARALEQGNSRGWIGRMALMREGRTVRGGARMNANWDTGIAFNNGASTYQNPVRLELKTTKYYEASRYAAAGTIFLAGKRCGIRDTAGIILGCAQEQGLLDSVKNPDFIRGNEPYSPGMLDAAFDSLRNEICAQKQRYNIPVEIPDEFEWSG